jgi:hypothetical protein
MNDALFLFLILLLGLVLCSFLGGNCGKEGMTTSTTSNNLVTGTTYTDANGNSITVISGNNGQALKLVETGQTTPIILTTKPPPDVTATANTYYAQPPLKFTATVVTASNGKSAIRVDLANGNTITLTETNTNSTSSTSSTNSTSSTGSANYDSYNHYNGTGSSTQLQTGTTFTSPNGDTVTIIVNSDGTQSLQYVQVNQTPIVLVSTPPSGTTATANTYYSQPPLTYTATVFTDNNGQSAIKITNTSSGQIMILTQYGSRSISSTQYYGSTGTPEQTGTSATSYTWAYGGSAGSVTGPGGNTAYYAQGPNGNTATGNTATGNTSSSYNPYYNGTSSTQYYGPYGGSAGSVSGPGGNTAYYAQGQNGNTATGNTATGTTSTGSSSDYYSSLPPGIPSSQIPSGQEDLYILKSQVVPPVCPACPAYNSSSSSSSSSDQSSSNNDPSSSSTCPPCPACARCPEPSFDCKKVPNYNSIDNNYLPQPVISSFSAFGM